MYNREKINLFARFDKEQRYDPIKVKEEDRDDALVKLQNIERSLLELSQQTLQPQVKL